MKKCICVMLMLALCLSLWACSGGGGPSEQPTEPKATIDPNAKPEIVTDPASVKQEPLDTRSEKPVCYFRTTEGTNCGVAGVVSVDYLDANEKVLHTFTPQLPGGTLSAGGFAGGETYVTERVDNRGISYAIDTETGKLLYCYYFEVNGRESIRSWIDLYDNNGQVATRVEVSKEGNTLYVDHTYDQWGNSWSILYDQFYVYETGSNVATVYADRTLYYKNQKLVAEIVGDPVTGLDDGMMFAIDRKVEIRNGRGEVIGVYEPSGENSLVGAGVSTGSDVVFVEEQRFDHKYLLREQIDPATGKKLSRETFDYSEDGTLIQSETTRWTEEGVVSYHCVTTYDASGNQIDQEIECWGGKVELTPHTTYTGLYTKAEFYDAEGVLQETVELVDGSIGFILRFGEEDRCVIVYYDKDGNDIQYASYWYKK